MAELLNENCINSNQLITTFPITSAMEKSMEKEKEYIRSEYFTFKKSNRFKREFRFTTLDGGIAA